MDLVFFLASKIIWMLISPGALLVCMLTVGLVLLWFKAVKPARAIFTLAMVIMLVITFLPVGDWVLSPLEKRFMPPTALPPEVDGIIMLAGPEHIRASAQWGQPEVGGNAERYFAFIHLIRAYPSARHVFTGGSGNPAQQELKSTLVARQLLTEQGVDISSILFESDSRNTYENARFSFSMVRPQADETWLLVTSAKHMPRSVGCFRAVGWNVVPYPVDHNVLKQDTLRVTFDFSGNLGRLESGLREWVGLVAYYLTGRTSSLFPGPRIQ